MCRLVRPANCFPLPGIRLLNLLKVIATVLDMQMQRLIARSGPYLRYLTTKAKVCLPYALMPGADGSHRKIQTRSHEMTILSPRKRQD
jgi:hypothetical protein